MTHTHRAPNLYARDGDHEVWERAQQAADAADVSLSRYVVAVLRDRQDRDDEAIAEHEAERHPSGEHPA